MAKLRRNVIEGQLEERLHRRRRLIDADAGLEPRKGPQNHLPRIGPAIRGAIESRGNKNVFVAQIWHFELRRNNNNNDGGPAVEGNRAARRMAVTAATGAPPP